MTESRRTRRLRLELLVAAATLVAAGVLSACGGGGDNPRANEDDPSSSNTTEASATTEPPGTNPAEVQPIVVDLLRREDDVTERVLRNPAQVLDETASIHDELAEIFTQDEYQSRLEVYRDNAANEVIFEPYNADHIHASTLMGDLSTVDANTVEAIVCTVYHYRITGPNGGEVKDGVANPSRVTVARVDGVWLIQRALENNSQPCDPEASS